MPTLRDCSIDDVLSSLEGWRPLQHNIEAGLFIAAVGFEDRAVACFEQWCQTVAGKSATALLITYPTNQADNREQYIKFSLLADAAGVTKIELEYSRLSLYGRVLALLEQREEGERVLVDLSSMASFLFYPLMSALCEQHQSLTIDICYSEAGEYFPSRQEWEAFQEKVKDLDPLERARLFDESHFQSSGVDHIYEALNFPGSNIDNLPTSLVIVPNFSFERVNRMVDYVSERYGSGRECDEWIIGIPPDQAKNSWRFDALSEMFNGTRNKHAASTLDYKQILLTLHNLWDKKHDSESLLIATVGSKAQHLGTFMFLLMHPEVGLVLSEPKKFTTSKYSAQVGNQWYLSLGKISDLKATLRSWSQIVFEW